MDNRVPKSPIEFDESLRNHRFISIDIEGDPFAKQRPRASRKGRFITVYTPRETKNYEKKVRTKYVSMYKDFQLTGDLTAKIEGIFKVPDSASKKKQQEMIDGIIPHTKKPDCDNIGKICLDALNGTAYEDDSTINTLIISKKYGENPMAKITIIENKFIIEEKD